DRRLPPDLRRPPPHSHPRAADPRSHSPHPAANKLRRGCPQRTLAAARPPPAGAGATVGGRSRRGRSSRAMASSGIAYPDRFYAAAAYAGFGAGAPSTAAISRFQNDVALLLYGLHQQATVGPCNVPKPRAWSPVEQSKWTSWHGLGSMPSAEAMRLFVKILEEEDPGWYSRIPEFINPQPVVDIEMHKPKEEPDIVPALTNGTGTSSIPEPKTISENGSSVETQDKVVILEGLSTVSAHEEWTALSVSGQRPKPRYEHGATVLQDKMYIFGGNHNGRYLSDLQVLDLKSLTWSKVDAKLQAGTSDSAKTAQVSPCAGHSLVNFTQICNSSR
uniref:ACB domain-containing protein n=1 Tax=Aegilops tauschii subsp. strangulata TaxID=200361 RepID=A0A453ME10_AEGTS